MKNWKSVVCDLFFVFFFHPLNRLKIASTLENERRQKMVYALCLHFLRHWQSKQMIFVTWKNCWRPQTVENRSEYKYTSINCKLVYALKKKERKKEFCQHYFSISLLCFVFSLNGSFEVGRWIFLKVSKNICKPNTRASNEREKKRLIIFICTLACAEVQILFHFINIL